MRTPRHTPDSQAPRPLSSVAFLRVLAVLCLSLGPFPGGALTASAQEPRAALEARAVVLAYGSGDPASCMTLGTVSLGAAVRTPGPWFGVLAADLAVPMGAACDDIGAPTVTYPDGGVAEQSGGIWLAGPQLGLGAGRRVSVGRVDLSVGVVGGAALGVAFWRDDEVVWNPWWAGAADLRRAHGRIGLVVEAGRHRTPMRHVVRRYVPETGSFAGPDEIRDFHRWKGLVRVGAAVRF